MPTFALNGKYTPEALAAVRKAGYASREAAGPEFFGQVGGKLVVWYWLSSPDWDFSAIVDLPGADDAYAIQSMANSTGAFQRTQALQVRTSAEADAAIARQLNWTPPGS